MKRLILLSVGAIALTACGGKNESAENGSALANLSAETGPANDASALEAVEAESARSIAIQIANETELDDSDSNVSSKQTNAN